MNERAKQLMQLWYDAHTAIRVFLEDYTDLDEARRLASRACAIWVQAAGDGMVTPSGPYAQLYAAAVYVLHAHLGVLMPVTDAELEAAVPVSTELLPYQLSKTYTDIWKASSLLVWDRKTVHRVAKGLGCTWPSSATTWSILGAEEISPLVIPLLRRAVVVLSEHECYDCMICGEAAVRWEEDDKRTETWNVNQRLARLE